MLWLLSCWPAVMQVGAHREKLLEGGPTEHAQSSRMQAPCGSEAGETSAAVTMKLMVILPHVEVRLTSAREQ